MDQDKSYMHIKQDLQLKTKLNDITCTSICGYRIKKINIYL
jgi:hypothetical protein